MPPWALALGLDTSGAVTTRGQALQSTGCGEGCTGASVGRRFTGLGVGGGIVGGLPVRRCFSRDRSRGLDVGVTGKGVGLIALGRRLHRLLQWVDFTGLGVGWWRCGWRIDWSLYWLTELEDEVKAGEAVLAICSCFLYFARGDSKNWLLLC